MKLYCHQKTRHWDCAIGDTLPEDYFACSSYWAQSFDPVTHAPRFFLRSFIWPCWLRLL